MALSPYFKPTVPFIGPINGGLKDGMTVLVTGNVLKCCRRFRVDFQCGNCQMPRSDVAFHFNVRFDQNCIVCNSHEKGCWQQKERKCDMVFRKGHPFEIRFLVNISSYVVLVDGKKYLKFKHRIPLSRVDNIGISGELNVDSVSFQGPITHPVCCKPICPTPSQTYPVCCKPICPTPSQTYPVCCKPICPTSSQVLVDGKLHLEFKHKVCLSQVNNIGISGQLGVDSVSFQGPFTHPVCCKPICPTPSQPSAYPIGQCFQPQIYHLPYRTTICGGFSPSKSIMVSGSVSPCAHSGQQSWQQIRTVRRLGSNVGQSWSREGSDEGSESEAERGPRPSGSSLLLLEYPESDISKAEEQRELFPVCTCAELPGDRNN